MFLLSAWSVLANVLATAPAYASLAAAGPVDPATSYPSFYRDTSGLALRLCATGANCVTDNAPLERYYFLAEASLTVGTGAEARLKLAVGAGYLSGTATPGQESTFGRVSVTVPGGLTPGMTYQITHPYGNITAQANNQGALSSITTVGCSAVPCDFAGALNTAIGPFLIAAAPAPPAGHIGNPAVSQTVTGSPFGTNFFRMQGNNVDGLGSSSVQTNQFKLMGQMAVIAANDEATVPTGADNVPIDVLANDTTSTSDPLSVATPGPGPASGSVVVAPANAWVVYGTNHSFTGADSFSYTATNGTMTSTATVNVTVHAGNAAPVATADTATLAFNGAATTINVLANDTDANSDSIFVSAITQGAKGTVAVGTAGRNVTYTPTAGAFGADSFTYTVSDGLATATGTVNVTINRAPVGVNDTATITANTSNNAISVLANDTDPDGNALTVSAVTQPSHGSAAIGTAGANVLYTPAPGYGGADSFTYTLSDGSLTTSATVNVTVNRSPVAVGDSTRIAQNSSGTAISVLANDTDPDGNALTVSAVTQPAHGTSAVGTAGASVTYTPLTGFAGNDSFSYTVSDGALTASGTVTVTVERAPLAADDTATVAVNSLNNIINVLANDLDPDGNSISVVAATQGATGAVSFPPGGANVSYTPRPGFFGADTFSYSITDGLLTATATVSIAVDRPPVPASDTVTVLLDTVANPLNVLANDSDPDGNTIKVTGVTQGQSGAVAFEEDGINILYTPQSGYQGSDGFTYTITDGFLTASAQVYVTVRRDNRPPVAVDDNMAVSANSSGNTLNVLANDVDPDGNPLRVISASQGANGMVVIGANGANILYTPRAGYTGAESLTYTISDGSLIATATVAVTVSLDTRPPVAEDDIARVPMNSTSNPIDVLANDRDLDGHPIKVVGLSPANSGTVSIGPGGGVVYTPNSGFSGTDTFSYSISGGSLTANANVSVLVHSADAPPFASADSFTVQENSSNNVLRVLANDSDPDGDSLSISAVTQGSHGTVTVGAGRANLLYTPAPGFVGIDSLTYAVWDSLKSATATVSLSISRAVNRPPVAVDDVAAVAQSSAGNSIDVLANDSDPDADSFAVISVSGPAHGSVALGQGGCDVSYLPNQGFTGTDSFTYTISDGSLTASATVTVIVGAVHAPVAVGDSFSVPMNSANNPLNVRGNDNDPDGQTLTISGVGASSHGTVSIGVGRTNIFYTPDPGFSGSDSFLYTLTDGSQTATAPVSITVHSANNPPSVVSDSATVPANGANYTINVLANDTDPDGDPLSVTGIGQGGKGTVAIGPGRGVVLYTPHPGTSGSDSFTYTAGDGSLTASGAVDIAIQGTKIFLPVLTARPFESW